MPPRKNKRWVILFKEYPEFTPNLTPQEIFEMGSFWRYVLASYLFRVAQKTT